jgi:hypothetical protein
MASMKLQHRAIWGNLGICCGLVLEYYRGVSLGILIATGAMLLVLFNGILLFRYRKQQVP